MPELVRCQICSSTDSKIIQSSHVYLNSAELNLVKCTQCGLVYLNPQPVKDEIEKLYSKEYFLKWYSTKEKREFSKNFFRGLLKQFKLEAKADHKLLDIGCGMGYFLEVAREWGWDAQGVEISPYAARHCKEQLNFDVHRGPLETANFQDEYFDVITAFDFLEHIRGLSNFLSVIKRILKEEGMFVTLVPNYDNLVFQVDRYIYKLKKVPLINVPEHLTYFTLCTLKQLLEKNGFEVDKLLTTGANDECEYLYLRGTPKAVLRAILNNLCYLFSQISNRRTAILAIARKGSIAA